MQSASLPSNFVHEILATLLIIRFIADTGTFVIVRLSARDKSIAILVASWSAFLADVFRFAAHGVIVKAYNYLEINQ